MDATDLELAKNIALAVKNESGEAFFVGEYVRDKLRGVDCEDATIEVYGLSFNKLTRVLDAFGIAKINHRCGIFTLNNTRIVVEMPRTTGKTASGGTKPLVDPHLDKATALTRRIFTMDAVMENVLTGKTLDPFNGKRAIRNGIVKPINIAEFSRNSILIFRAAALATKLGFKLSNDMADACCNIDTTHISKEKMFELVRDVMLNAKRPSIFFRQLNLLHCLDYWFAEVKALIGVPQNEIAHKEGDVWTHTMLVLDEAANKRDCADNPFGLMLAALCHDFGKAVATSVDDKGIHHSYEHEIKGLPLVLSFLNRLGVEDKQKCFGNNNTLKPYVLNMVELHQEPHKKVRQNSSQKSFNHLFDRSICPMDLISLADCDCRGKKPVDTEEVNVLFDKFNTYCKIMSEPYVTEDDLKDAGVVNGERLGELMEYAHKLRLAGIGKDDALKQTLTYKPHINKERETV